jgi:hypothetical protein
MTWIIGVHTIKQLGANHYAIFINGKVAMQAQHFVVAFMWVMDERAKPSDNFKNFYNPPPADPAPEAPAP